MTQHVLQGPFLTRKQAAHRAEVSARLLPDRPDLIHIGGQWLEEVYCAFQFDDHGVRPDIGQVVVTLRGSGSDEAIAEWLVRPNPDLGGTSPLDFLNGHGGLDQVLDAAARERSTDEPRPDAGQIKTPGIGREKRVRQARRRRTAFPHAA